MLAKHGLKPHEALFVDDTPDNAITSRLSGMPCALLPDEDFEYARNVLLFLNVM